MPELTPEKENSPPKQLCDRLLHLVSDSEDEEKPGGNQDMEENQIDLLFKSEEEKRRGSSAGSMNLPSSTRRMR